VEAVWLCHSAVFRGLSWPPDAEMSHSFCGAFTDSMSVYLKKTGTSFFVAGHTGWCGAHCVNSAITRFEVFFMTVKMI
jgi:hypothetical protein